MKESVIENAILQYLNTQGHFAVKIPDQRQCIDGVYQKHPYMPPGLPDILCVYKNKTIFFEVKNHAGRLSRVQKLMHSKMVDVYIVRSIGEVQHLLSILDHLHHPKA